MVDLEGLFLFSQWKRKLGQERRGSEEEEVVGLRSEESLPHLE